MKKGFTLIELLGVIILLSIIALIATPIVTSIINNSKSKVFERSCENYIRAVNTSIKSYNLKNSLSDATCTIESNGDLDCDGITINVNVESNPATSGTITITNYDVSEYSNVKINNKTCPSS